MRPSAGDPRTLLRNASSARRLHAGVYVTTALLLLSGFAVSQAGWPVTTLLGGHAATARWHRWVGFVMIGAGLALPILRTKAVARFAADSFRFRWADLRWFASWPGVVLRPSRHALARHEGHFDPGQRVFNCLCVCSFVALSLTGVVMSFPAAVTPAVFTWSLRIHRMTTVVLILSVCGHVLIASGLLRAYRGVHRAMHEGGEVSFDTARMLWPYWAEEHVSPDKSSGCWIQEFDPSAAPSTEPYRVTELPPASGDRRSSERP